LTKGGDKYVKNANGTYTYFGRSGDMLKISGSYVSHLEVEATLVQQPAGWKQLNTRASSSTCRNCQKLRLAKFSGSNFNHVA
jgi:hypothetical protein